MDTRFLWRGKRIDNGEWVKGNLLRRSPDETFIAELFHDGQWFSTPRELCGSVLQVDSETIGQSAGLFAAKSCRGDGEPDKLVFEGDIVRYSSLRETLEGVVEWCNCQWVIRLNNGVFKLFDKIAIEICDNIHDHAMEGKS